MQPGQTLTYTLTITNNGNQGATGVTVSDTLPANTTFVSASDGGTFNGGVVTWNIGPVAAGATLTRTVTVVVNGVIPAGVTQIINTASVQDDGSNGPDPNPANNTASDTDTLNAAPDLVITKTDGLTSVVPGQTVTYTLTVTNVGTQDATGVVVTDILPEHTTFVSARRRTQPARRRLDPGRRQPGRGRQRHAGRHRAGGQHHPGRRDGDHQRGERP